MLIRATRAALFVCAAAMLPVSAYAQGTTPAPTGGAWYGTASVTIEEHYSSRAPDGYVYSRDEVLRTTFATRGGGSGPPAQAFLNMRAVTTWDIVERSFYRGCSWVRTSHASGSWVEDPKDYVPAMVVSMRTRQGASGVSAPPEVYHIFANAGVYEPGTSVAVISGSLEDCVGTGVPGTRTLPFAVGFSAPGAGAGAIPYMPRATKLAGSHSETVPAYPNSASGPRTSTYTWDLTLAPDGDGDGFANETDNCPAIANADQKDSDGDQIGDACDPTVGANDTDLDGIVDTADTCPMVADPSNADSDRDGKGDVCDPPDPIDLVAKYAPLINLDPNDTQSYPMDPATFVSLSRLSWANRFGGDAPITAFGAVDVDRLTGRVTPYVDPNDFKHRSSYDLTAPAAADNPAHATGHRSGFYLELPDDEVVRKGNVPIGNPPGLYPNNIPLYYEFSPGRFIIYWFFYGFNGRTLDEHEGDWEKIVVKLDAGNNATAVAYYQHYCEPTDLSTTYGAFSWQEMASRGYLAEGTHPIVFSARFAHASYPTNVGELMKPCASLLDGLYDRTGAGGFQWRTWEGPLANAAQQNWYGFGGGWGRKRDLLDGSIVASPGWGPLGPGDVMWRVAPPLPKAWLTQLGESATPASGNPVTVVPRELRQGSAPVSVTFSSVKEAGDTFVTTVPPHPNALSGFRMLGVHYDIRTTAKVEGPITVCFTIEGITDPLHFARLQIIHWQDGTPAIATARTPESIAPDFATRRLCATTSSLSPFAIAEPDVADPTVSLSSSSLAFAAVAAGGGTLGAKTAGQPVALRQNGAGTVTWTATPSQPWISVSPSSGTGPATITIAVQSSAGMASPGTLTGAVTLAVSGASNTLPPIEVKLSLLAPTDTAAPFGVIDTPLAGASGLTGSIAVTGWALDDLGVTRVRILRDPVAGEASALIYIGDASLIEGARPDVAAANPGLPRNTRGGWGYLMLTNFLPNEGNGSFRLHAYADDVEGRTTLLGSRLIGVANASAVAPFGAIDTPGQGELISGVVNNFGWVLGSGGRRADVPSGGTVTVFVDGFAIGSPAGWSSRADLTALFPIARYPGVTSALAVHTFDTRTLADGVHTIAWSVIDDEGNGAGIGSRYFTVANGVSAITTANGASAALRSGPETDDMRVRRGFDNDIPWRAYPRDAPGVVVIDGEELDRFEIHVPGLTAGHLVTAGVTAALPIGSRLDPATATFTWQPGVGFVGAYDFAFETTGSVRLVRVVLHAKGSGRVGPQVVIDAPAPDRVHDGGFHIGGWAADLDAATGTGVDAVHVWAYPVTGQPAVFLGAARYGGERPDVGAVYGDRVRAAGFGLDVNSLAPGAYDVAVFAFSIVRNGFLPATTVRVTVR